MKKLFYYKSCVFQYRELKTRYVITCVNCAVVRQGHGTQGIVDLQHEANQKGKELWFEYKECLDGFLPRLGYKKQGKYFRKVK